MFLIENYWLILFTWLLMAIGNGTVGHRYFAHNQFKVSYFMHWVLSFWCTLSAYSSVLYWQVQHKHHHRHSDDSLDIHSPANGFLQSFLFWAFSKKRIESVFNERSSKVAYLKAISDPAVKFNSENFISINLIFLLSIAIININLLYCILISFVLEHLRLGIINTILHIEKIPGNYRNHQTKDLSQNNLIVGILSLGFGWHNNHHADPTKLILTENWWELDIEGLIGKILAKE